MQSIRPVVNLLRRNVRGAHHGTPYKPPNMNEMPVPYGSWQDAYQTKNRKYNAVLAAGIGFFAFSVITAKQSGLFYFNFYAPKTLD